VRVLLDTHTLLWAKISPEKLSRQAAEIMAEPLNEVLVSAVSAWEIVTKVRLGKLPGIERLEREFLEIMEKSGYTMLPINVANALRAGRLPAPRRDPFDRMLAAQALASDVPILSKDPKLDAFGIRRLW
jgi:PIN domain nuclease of toxin-antitoxin system